MNPICFEVVDLKIYRQHLKELGIEVHLEANYEPGVRIYFYDPDGIEIELVEYRD